MSTAKRTALPSAAGLLVRGLLPDTQAAECLLSAAAGLASQMIGAV